MMRRVGVLVIHGMGSPEPGFADGLIHRLRAALGDEASGVVFEACHWAPILQQQQDVTWQRLLTSGPLHKKSARRWVVSALGDPASYLAGYLRRGRPAYEAVHECVRDSLRALERRLGQADAPLVILAHSLGGVVISNYVWDMQRREGVVTPRTEKQPATMATAVAERLADGSPLLRMETLATLITYGCNIPLFLPPSPPIECIRFPPPQLPPALGEVARWLNVYDPDDLLGYPMARIWDDTKGTRIEDIALDVGGWPLSETPFSHVAYDRDARFVEMVRDQLRAVLRVTAHPASERQG